MIVGRPPPATVGEDPAAGLAAHPLVARVIPALGPETVLVVGGAVRDALLGVGHGDEVDLVVVGDAPALARRLGHALGAEVSLFPRFGTAELSLPEGRVDLVGARREHYPRPGALPVVEPGSLADDLSRRDFTVNAMAFGLGGEGAGLLHDPHGGRADLDARLLRTLRAGSFAEDPSRLVRAARYVARLGLRLEPATAAEAAAAAPALDPGSARVADELGRLARELPAGPALAVLARIGVPWVLPGAGERVAAIDRALAAGGAPDLAPWAARLGAAVDGATLRASALPGWVRDTALAVGEGWSAAPHLTGLRRLSQLDAALARAHPAFGVGALAGGAEGVARWWTDARDRRAAIDGDDLRRAGIAPGPALGRGLLAARAAMLDGATPDAEGQLAVAIAAARESS